MSNEHGESGAEKAEPEYVHSRANTWIEKVKREFVKRNFLGDEFKCEENIKPNGWDIHIFHPNLNLSKAGNLASAGLVLDMKGVRSGNTFKPEAVLSCKIPGKIGDLVIRENWTETQAFLDACKLEIYKLLEKVDGEKIREEVKK